MSALDVLGGLVLDDGRRWAEAATSWQRADAEAILEPTGGAPRFHWLGRPKGGSKTTDLAGMTLAWLVEQAPPLVEGYAVAADLEQANRLLDAARRFVARVPALQAVVEVQAMRIVHRVSGARVQALAADVASSEGLLTPWIVVDELPNWSTSVGARGMWTSVISSVAKVPGCRLVVIGHAGDPGHWSHKVLEQARSEAAWRVNEVPGPLPWLPEDMLRMQERSLLPSQFRRRHLNEWTAPEDRLSSGDDLAACVTLDGPQEPVGGRQYVIGLDLARSNDRTVAAVCHTERDGQRRRVQLDRMEVWAGSRAKPVDFNVVEDWVAMAARTYRGAEVVFDPWQAFQMVDNLKRRGIRTTQVSQAVNQISQRAMVLYGLVRDHLLAIYPDDDLLDELANVRLVEKQPGVFRVDHDPDKHDDRAMALAMAATHLLQRPSSTSRAFVGGGVAPPTSEAKTSVEIERVGENAYRATGRVE